MIFCVVLMTFWSAGQLAAHTGMQYVSTDSTVCIEGHLQLLG